MFHRFENGQYLSVFKNFNCFLILEAVQNQKKKHFP